MMNNEIEASRLGNIIVVENMPVLPLCKVGKLEAIVGKILGPVGGMFKDDGLRMPLDPVINKSLGYCTIEFNTPQDAELAREKLHGYRLDKSHTFSVRMFNSSDRFM